MFIPSCGRDRAGIFVNEILACSVLAKEGYRMPYRSRIQVSYVLKLSTHILKETFTLWIGIRVLAQGNWSIDCNYLNISLRHAY